MPIPNYDLIRPDIRQALRDYADKHWPVGHFLTAVLSNNLSAAFSRADEENCETLFHICCYVYNEIPGAACGTPAKVAAWLLLMRKEQPNG